MPFFSNSADAERQALYRVCLPFLVCVAHLLDAGQCWFVASVSRWGIMLLSSLCLIADLFQPDLPCLYRSALCSESHSHHIARSAPVDCDSVEEMRRAFQPCSQTYSY